MSLVKYLVPAVCGLLLFVMTVPSKGYCSDHFIATLTDFSGRVLVKSRGSWSVEPKKGLRLYSHDKVVTRIGSAVITFVDGTSVKIYNNSNILIHQKERKGIGKKIKVVKRHILLFLGKLFFKTGREKIETSFETTTALVGIRGTAGVLSIGADGATYIRFTEGRAVRRVGRYIREGIAKEVLVEIADRNPIQRAAYIAVAAAEECENAKKKFEKGEISRAQADWACARAVRLSAKEVLTWSVALIKNNPDAEVVSWASEQEKEALALEKEAIEMEKDAIRRGAKPTPSPEAYEAPEAPEFETPLEPPGPESSTWERPISQFKP